MAGRPGGVYLDFPGEHVARRVDEERAAIRARAPELARPHPDPAAVERAADLLARAEHPLVVVGKGAAWAGAGPALQRLVGLGIPYVTSPMGRGIVPDDDPHFMNGARSAALAGADVILMVGARFNWLFGFGRPPRYRKDLRIVQVDLVAEADDERHPPRRQTAVDSGREALEAIAAVAADEAGNRRCRRGFHPLRDRLGHGPSLRVGARRGAAPWFRVQFPSVGDENCTQKSRARQRADLARPGTAADADDLAANIIARGEE